MSTMEFLLTRAEKLEDLMKSSLEVPYLLSNFTKAGIFGAGLAIILTIGFLSNILINTATSKSSIDSKTQRSLHMKQVFNSRERENGAERSITELNKHGEPTMEISQLWVYPIKALRGCQLPQATLTKEGFSHDRKFVLLKDLGETPRKFQHISITKYPNVCLFHTTIQENTLTVTYRPPRSREAEAKHLEIPLEPPNLGSLERVKVDMHGSPNNPFVMGEKYNKWFSEIFGFKVLLAFWGHNPRYVLGNLPSKPATVSSKPKNVISNFISQVPVLGPILSPDEGVIAFNDCAPYLVITEESAEDASSRLPEGSKMDITKFRANIILKKSPSAFDEDFWGELLFAEDTKVILTGNCGRCTSLNIDYETGKPGKGPEGQVLKLLNKDRRVDAGWKYSPIFGRYGFVSRRSEGRVLRVGDEVVVGRRNKERTRFYWPSIST